MAGYYRLIDVKRMEDVARLVPAGNRVLDIGAYNGTFAKMVRGCEVIGIDTEPKGEGVMKATVTHLPFKDKAFNYVVAMEILEHLDNEELGMAMDEIVRVARDAVIISVPLDEVPLGEGHKQRFSRSRVVQLLPEPTTVMEVGERKKYAGVRKWLGMRSRKALWMWNVMFGDRKVKGAVWMVVKYRMGY